MSEDTVIRFDKIQMNYLSLALLGYRFPPVLDFGNTSSAKLPGL